MKKNLAIIIPFFKIDFFEDTLLSLANQNDQNFNVYIGNDASNANPEKLIEQYNKNKNMFYHRFSENLGSKGKLVEQWNRCINMSSDEEWLMILADDDFISENFVEEFYKSIEEAQNSNIDLLRFKMRRVSEKGEFLVDLEQPKLYPGENYVWDDEIHKRFLSISENVFSRKIYEEKGFRNYPLAWRIPMMMYLDFANERNVLGINNAFVAIRRSDVQLSWRKDVDTFKKQAMKLCYYDILNEYSGSFSDEQNLKFLKVYNFYANGENKLNKSFSSLFMKYGGIKEYVKYKAKKILNK